jgi:hypothetical protein
VSDAREKWLASMDPGIAPFVNVLDAAGIETYESCEGGESHAYAEPGIRFHGDIGAGFKALSVAVEHGFPVCDLRRFWSIRKSGEPDGPHWELVFSRIATHEEWEDAQVQVAHLHQLKANAGRALVEAGLAEGWSPEETDPAVREAA